MMIIGGHPSALPWQWDLPHTFALVFQLFSCLSRHSRHCSRLSQIDQCFLSAVLAKLPSCPAEPARATRVYAYACSRVRTSPLFFLCVFSMRMRTIVQICFHSRKEWKDRGYSLPLVSEGRAARKSAGERALERERERKIVIWKHIWSWTINGQNWTLRSTGCLRVVHACTHTYAYTQPFRSLVLAFHCKHAHTWNAPNARSSTYAHNKCVVRSSLNVTHVSEHLSLSLSLFRPFSSSFVLSLTRSSIWSDDKTNLSFWNSEHRFWSIKSSLLLLRFLQLKVSKKCKNFG